MERTNRQRRPGPRGRAAFTLVELMVVMLIIAILMALSAAAVLRFVGTQQRANTISLVRRLAARLDSQVRLVTQQAMQEPIGLTGPNASTIQKKIMDMAGNHPERARVIWVKLRLKQAFPNDFTEALNPGGGVFSPAVFPPLPTYQKYLSAASVSVAYDTTTGVATLSNGLGQPVESSVCLLMALQQGQGGSGMNAEDIGNSFLKDVPATTGTVKVIVDGWGTPLAFCRWPYQSDILNPGATHIQAGLVDPGDPRGLLTESNWLASTAPSGPTPFASMLGYTPPLRNGTNPQSYNLTPVIVSAGGDMSLGLNPSAGLATSPAGNQDLFDDLYSTQLAQQ